MRLLITLIIAGTLVTNASMAEESAKETPSRNDCHDKNNKQGFDDLLKKNPTDTGIIKLYALRQGLCEMIDNGLIPLDTGINLWELERSKLVIERHNEEMSSGKLML